MTRPLLPADQRSRRWPVAAFAGWTLLIWATRIDNIWSDDALDTAGKVSRTALAVSFVALSAVVLAGALRDRGSLRPATVTAVKILAAWTVAVWLVRGGAILAGSHDAAFKVVHTVLAVVSIALAAVAVRALPAVVRSGPATSERPTPASGSGSRRRP